MKVKLTLEYPGERFSGWQIQPDLPTGKLTVQGELERALKIYLDSLAKKSAITLSEKIVIMGSGRTDAGVHARGQVASFTWPSELEFDGARLQESLNGITVPELIIRNCDSISDDFDARLSPHIKCYCYRFLLRSEFEGLSFMRAWRVRPDLNVAEMVRAARYFQGQHDFSSFRAQDCTAKTTERTILVSQVARINSEELAFVVHGKGFLKQMIRIMAGTLMEVGSGKRNACDMPALIESRNRQLAGETAPAHGLYLEWVNYSADGL